MRLAEAPFSGKGLAPFLDIGNAERGDACARVANLFFEMRNSKKEFLAAGHVLEPLLRLLPEDARAAEPLATMAHILAGGQAYPEALRCIDAVVDRASDVPLGHTVRRHGPWYRDSKEPMTWPREQALLRLARGECLLAAGDAPGGEAALAAGIASAAAAEMPPFFRLSPSMYDYGTADDFRLIALTRAARALRLRFEGRDATPYRSIPKPKRGAAPDPGALSTARAYLDEALAVIGPRAAELYAGLVPATSTPELSQRQKDYAWQWHAYFESALVDEHLGTAARARLHLGRAKAIAALVERSQGADGELGNAVLRLGVEDAALDG